MTFLMLRWLVASSAVCGAHAALETWHLVDLAAAMCPKPPSLASTSYQYAVGINLTADIAGDMPYIVSFMRKSSKAMNISFKMVDADGTEVLSETTIRLNALDAAVPDDCTCYGKAMNGNLPGAKNVIYPVYGDGYGATCKAWDEQNCGEWWGDNLTGSWCCAQWCYASEKCPDAYASSLLPGVYYSYKACSNPSSLTNKDTCPWTAKATKRNPCTCRNMGESFSDIMKAKFASDYGASCSAWDMEKCAQDYSPDQVDTWCCKNWCYVDAKCPSAFPSLNEGMGNTLFWSSNVCTDDAAKMAQCPYKPEPSKNSSAVKSGSCDCLNETMPADVLPPGVPADFGRRCAPHDAERCDVLYPGAKTDMWCCMSWCWVSPDCPGSQESTHWPGHFTSQASCDMDVDLVSGCPWNPTACECIASPGSAALNKNGGKFPDDYGSSCKAWDAVGCKATWGNDQAWSGSNHEWCCDSWCYVSEKCPIAKRSWLGLDYLFSYETCDDSNKSYKDISDSCEDSRRLVSPRRLAGRRRWGGGSWSSYSSYSSYSSWSSPRRRSWSSYSSWSSGSSYRRRSPPAPPISSRRRGISAPSYPRRRSFSYGSSYSSPYLSPRRRSSIIPSTARRRRSTDIRGDAYSTARRRDILGPTLGGERRRRSSYEGGYGYVNRHHLFLNCPGYMPYNYPYGYVCPASVYEEDHVNIAFYASDYATSSYYNADDGYHRYSGRRRENGAKNGWCVVPDCREKGICLGYDEPGDMIQCDTCRQRYNFCLSSSECRTSSGCGYTTKAAFNRDDLAQTGFIPQDYKAPFSVVFTRIESEDLNPDPSISNICPPQTEEEKDQWEKKNMTQAIKADLFVLLTRQEKLDAPSICETKLSRSCVGSCIWDDNAWCNTARAPANALFASSGMCECNPGYCVVDGDCQAESILEPIPEPTPVPTYTPFYPDCYDYNTECPDWKMDGECGLNPDYMRRNCKLSCNSCHESDLDASTRRWPRFSMLAFPLLHCLI